MVLQGVRVFRLLARRFRGFGWWGSRFQGSGCLRLFAGFDGSYSVAL